MIRAALACLLLALAACGNTDNLILGAASSTSTTPPVIFEDVNSSISGVATLSDANGNPIGRAAVVILSGRPDLCNTLKAHRDYFRNPPEAYEAIILIMPLDFLGTFVIGRGGTPDLATMGEIIAVNGPQTVTPFTAVSSSNCISEIALTNWADNAGGNAIGSFDMCFADPDNLGLHLFQGRFKTNVCPTLDGTLLP